MSHDESIFLLKIFWSFALLTPPVALSIGNYSPQKDESLIFVGLRG